MNEKDLEINKRLISEFDLEPGFRQIVCDHESGNPCKIGGKDVVMPGSEITRQGTIEFDPINNSRMMNFFFGSYVHSLAEDGILEGDILSFSTIPSKTPGKIKAVLKLVPYDGEGIKEISSKPYINETSCYADLVCKINGDTDVDMSEYDYDRKKPTQEPKQSKKKGSRR